MPITCPAIDGFYLRANGSFPCWNSPGEMIPIAHFDGDNLHGVDFVRDVLNGAEYKRMRQELLAHREPFDYCHSCSWGNAQTDEPLGRFDHDTLALHTIGVLQIEPSFLCNLDCPQCIPIGNRKKDAPPYSLDTRLFRQMIDDLVQHKIKVECIQYGGFGEPLMTRSFPEIARYAKEKLGCPSACDTNGNFDFREELMDCGVDWYVLAFDGVDQESYVRYRRRGKLARVMEFASRIRDHKKRNGGLGPNVAWKMVLFDWNSSDEDLREACRLAETLKVNQVRFVNSTTPGGISHGNRTQRAREIHAFLEELQESCSVPLLYDNPDCFAGESSRSHGFIEALVEEGQGLHLSGWMLLDDGPPDRISCRTPSGEEAFATPIARPDLTGAHPTIPDAQGGGFRLSLPADRFLHEGCYRFEVRLLRGDVERVSFQVEAHRDLSSKEASGPLAIRHGRLMEVSLPGS